MKRLNKKGFTLVELLAVIIILAVVVGFTIPAVLGTVSGAKESAFETAAETAADWFDRQYQAFMVGDTTISPVDSNFNTFCNINTNDSDRDGSFTCAGTVNSALIAAAGLTANNIETLTVQFSSGRSCVVLTSKTGGDYVTNKYVAGSTSTAGGACATQSKTIGLKAKA